MLKEVFDSYALTLQRTFDHDRSTTVGSSEIGLCARKTFWFKFEGTKKGVKRDDDYEDEYGARVRGTVMEDHFWYPAMARRYGANLLIAGPCQTTLVSGHISCTPDGLVVNQPRDCLKTFGIEDIGESSCFMAECKTIDPRTNLIEAKTENLFQAQVQLGLVRQKYDWQPNYNLITYTDASFWNEIHEFPIEYDAEVFEAAKKRATIIMTADNGAELPPEGWIAGGKECSFCPFVGPCGVERRSIPRNNAKASPQFVAEMIDAANEFNALKEQSVILKAKRRELEDAIKLRLRAKGVRRIENVINWYNVAPPVRYSSREMQARLIELGEDIDDFASEGEPSDRLIVSPQPGTAKKKTSVMPGELKKRKLPKAKGKKRKCSTAKTKQATGKTKNKPTSKTRSPRKQRTLSPAMRTALHKTRTSKTRKAKR